MSKEKHTTEGKLMVSGEGEVKAKPDVATIEVGVLTENKSAATAISDNAKQMYDLIKRLKAGMGVPEGDLQTVGFSVWPIMEDRKDDPNYGKVVAYRVENMLNVRISPDKAGTVLDEAAAAGAGEVRQVTFGFRNDAAQRDEALGLAVRAAMHKAKLVAKTMEISLHGPTEINVSYGGRIYANVKAMAYTAERSTPLEPGVLSVSANVSITYAISS